MLSTAVSCILFLICVFGIEKLYDNRVLLFIFGFNIIGTTAGVEWVNVVFEDYKRPAIRLAIIQLISLFLIFVLIKDEKDYIGYAFLSIFPTWFSNIVNFIYVRKYVVLKFTCKVNLKKHFKPILLIFFNSLAITIYVSLDMTLLGFLGSDSDVAAYAVVSKLYIAVKTIFEAIIAVLIPRIASREGDGGGNSSYVYIRRIINYL